MPLSSGYRQVFPKYTLCARDTKVSRGLQLTFHSTYFTPLSESTALLIYLKGRAVKWKVF